MTQEMIFKFPEKFLWGAATSAHQVEGDNHNDWSEWEKENANRLAQEADRRFLKLMITRPTFRNQLLDPSNYISGRATDHYHLYESDFDIAKSLGHNAHRFSIEWSRIEPKEGRWDEQEIEHYRSVIKALRARDIEPFVTLWHWTIPLWLRDKGGVGSKEFPFYFVRFAEKIAGSFKNNVRYWVTFNEPEIYTTNVYIRGIWPPQKRNIFISLKVLRNLIKAHRTAYESIKKISKTSYIGVAKNNIYFEAYQDRLVNRVLKKCIDWWWNFYFLNRIKNQQDFIGLNHYFHNRINYGFNKNKNKKISDMGWELYPEAIYYVLKDLKRFNKPIYITENGLADAKDEKREWFILESLKNISKAIGEGADVRGYFHWSLLDNFEWDKGFWPRFGLVEIDYKTLERKIRSSAWEYKKIIERGSIDE